MPTQAKTPTQYLVGRLRMDRHASLHICYRERGRITIVWTLRPDCSSLVPRSRIFKVFGQGTYVSTLELSRFVSTIQGLRVSPQFIYSSAVSTMATIKDIISNTVGNSSQVFN